MNISSLNYSTFPEIDILHLLLTLKMEKDQKVGKIRLLFARHGETEANFTGVICGQQPGKLTTLGEEQAQRIGVHFTKEQRTFDFIYVSDLARTVATFDNCKSRAQHLEQVKTILTPLIR